MHGLSREMDEPALLHRFACDDFSFSDPPADGELQEKVRLNLSKIGIHPTRQYHYFVG
jgi:hypothetical protein